MIYIGNIEILTAKSAIYLGNVGFYSEKAKASLEGALGQTDVSMKSDIGYAVQAGVDIDLTDKVFLNLDVKYIDINTRAKLSTAGAGVQTVQIDLDPIVAGIGFGMRF